MSFRVEQVTWRDAKPQLMSVRVKVFCCEWRIPESLEFDGRDPDAQHVLAYDEEGEQPVATGRLLMNGELGHVAVLIPQRSSEVGKEVVTALLDIAKQKQLDSVCITCALDAVDYYQGMGFKPLGNVFMEAGIARQKLQCATSRAEVDVRHLDSAH